MSFLTNGRRLEGKQMRRAVLKAMVVLVTIGFGRTSGLRGQDADSGTPASDQRAAVDEASAKNDSAAKDDSSADPQSERTAFLRLTQNETGEPKAMQTAITRYQPKKGNLVIDLIAAVHIGEAEYYEQLNKQFELYDVVLYELVAPEGTRVPAGGKAAGGASSPMGAISWLQKKAQTTLGLESQLERIDYQKRNFTHADMSPAEIGKKMAERGESPLTIGLSAFSEMLRSQNRVGNESKGTAGNALADQLASEGLWEVMGNPMKLKQMLAGQFAQTGALDSGLGATLNQMLVTDRNEAAIKVMRQEVAAGKRKIAIFYGAAHMPDFEKRLVSEFGLKKTKQIWVDAWDLTTAPQAAPADKTSSLLKKLLEAMDD